MVEISFKLCSIKQKQSKYLKHAAEPQTLFKKSIYANKIEFIIKQWHTKSKKYFSEQQEKKKSPLQHMWNWFSFAVN